MKVIFGILFAVIIGLVGARFSGWLADYLMDLKTFESPDQVAQFRVITELSVTLGFAIIGAFIGVWVSLFLRRHFFRQEI